MSDKAFEVRLVSEKPFSLNVSIDSDDSDIVALVGPSGSGKTTVLRSIAGLHTVQKGFISINNQTWFDSGKKINLKPQQRSAGLLFQDHALFPHKTALENIAISIKNRNKQQTELFAKLLLKQVHLSGLDSRYPQQLSGGQKQRVALARALAREPNILLLDEPFSSVDHLTKRKLIRELALLTKDLNIPIIIVTHDLDEARVLANNICIIHHGKTLQQAPTGIISTRPDNKQVAKLLGIRNIFEGIVAGHSTDKKFTYIDWLGKKIETHHQDDLKQGEKIDWLIPTENIVLHRKDKPSNGEKENPVAGIIQEILVLGEAVHLSVIVEDKHRFAISLSSHVAKRNHLEIGNRINFSLLADSIHIMRQQL